MIISGGKKYKLYKNGKEYKLPLINFRESLNTGIIAKYDFNETSGDLIDSINGYNGVLTNGGAGITRGVSGRIGNCYQFDGNVHSGIITSLTDQVSFSSFSLSIWVNYMNFTQVLFSKKISNSDVFFQLGKLSTNINFNADFDDQPNQTTINTSVIYDTWVNYIAVVDDINKKYKVYENGILKGSFDFSGFTFQNNSQNFVIANGASDNLPFYGKIDQTAIWDRPLKQIEIEALATGIDF